MWLKSRHDIFVLRSVIKLGITVCGKAFQTSTIRNSHISGNSIILGDREEKIIPLSKLEQIPLRAALINHSTGSDSGSIKCLLFQAVLGTIASM